MVLLCDGGLAINVLSSILMNGVCCLHNLSAEEERNRQQAEELRRTINVEYERQRLFDKECRDRMRREEQLLHRIGPLRMKMIDTLAESARHSHSHSHLCLSI